MTNQPGPAPPLIACLNSSEDVVQLLAEYLHLDGFRTASHAAPTLAGTKPTLQFLTQVRPDAYVYCVSLPYEESWREFEALRAAMPDVPFVLTTVNKRGLEAAVGPTDSVEVFGRPFDLEQVCAAVHRALAGRSAART